MALGTAAAVAGIAKLGGSIFAGLGASKRAKAIGKATKQGAQRVSAFSDKFAAESKALKGTKLGILEESENVFDRLGGFIFGDTDTLDSLREAQSEFAALGAGDTSGFTREVESIVKSAFASTFGAPRGAFENLSARNLFDFRSRGLANALSLTSQISGLGQGLINTEFGIHDQDFDNRLKIRGNEVNQLNQLSLAGAGVQGTGLAGFGNALNTIGQGVAAFGNAQSNQRTRDIFDLGNLIRIQQLQNQNLNNEPGIAVPIRGRANVPEVDFSGGSFGGPAGFLDPELPSGSGSISNDLFGGFPVAPITVQPFGFNPGEFSSLE